MATENSSEKKTVFLIEDDTLMSDLMIKELMAKGYRILSATNGEDAFKILEKDTPDIFILDVLLPGMTGFDVLARIKKNVALQKIPAIYLSNMQAREDLEKSKTLGANAYYIKALVTPRMVAEEVSRILNQK